MPFALVLCAVCAQRAGDSHVSSASVRKKAESAPGGGGSDDGGLFPFVTLSVDAGRRSADGDGASPSGGCPVGRRSGGGFIASGGGGDAVFL